MGITYSAETLEEVDDCIDVDVLAEELIDVADMLAIFVASHS